MRRVLTICMILLLFGCSKKFVTNSNDNFGQRSFMGKSGVEPPKPEVSPPGKDGVGTVMIILNDANYAADVDVAWVIDNSNSMSDISEAVINHLTDFENEIAANGGGVKNFKSVDYGWDIGFSDPPCWFLSGLGVTEVPEYRCSRNGYRAGLNLIRDFFRPAAKHVIAVISDEPMPEDLPAQRVQQYLKDSGDDDIIFFSFVGTGNEDCDVSSIEAVEYIKLATDSGGQAFDLCTPDWKPAFDQIIKRISDAIIDLRDTPVDKSVVIIEITVNGKVLASDDYSLTENRLELKASIANIGDRLVIRYKQ